MLPDPAMAAGSLVLGGMISMTVTPLDLAAVRAQFPGLAREVNGQPAVFFDGPAGSQTPRRVIDAIAGYMTHTNANIEGAFVTSIETDVMIQLAREAGADLLGVDSDEIVFGLNTTTINFLLAHAVARTLQPGDEIVVSQLDHDANISPWLLVAQDHELIVKMIPLDSSDATLDETALDEVIGPRTRVVACTLASNAVGTIPNQQKIGAAARRVGALHWVDGVHFAPHRRIDRDTLGADVILTSAYKYFGPHLGVAAVRRSLAERLPADRVRPAGETPIGHRFETGTQSHEAIAGLVAAVDYIASLGKGATRATSLDGAFERIVAHEEALARHLLARLAEIDRCRVYGVTDPNRIAERTPTFAFTIDGLTPRAVCERLGQQGIFAWDGNYYALEAMTALGLEERGGAVRVGLLHYATLEEVDRFCDAVGAL